MRRALALAAALLVAPPAATACDPAEMEQAMTEICTAATTGAEEAVQAAQPHATTAEQATMAGTLAALQRRCAAGDPAVAAADAARLARMAGRIEARGEGVRPASLTPATLQR